MDRPGELPNPVEVGAYEPGRSGSVEFGDLSAFFNPFLSSFADASLRMGGQVRLARRAGELVGLSLLHPADASGSIFTRDESTARVLFEGLPPSEVFAEFPLTAGAEVYRVYGTDLEDPLPPHRFGQRVRAVRVSDRAGLIELLRELYGRLDEGWFRPVPPPPEQGFVVESEGRIVGAAWVATVPGHARFHTLSVRPRYRRLGIGTDLWHARALWAVNHGARHVVAEIAESNRGSVTVATAAGMRPIGDLYRCRRA